MRRTKESYISRRNYNRTEPNQHYRKKLCASHSTPLSSRYDNPLEDDNEDDFNSILSVHEKNRFLKEIGQVRQDILRFKKEMNGLARQMDGMEIDLNLSKDRVHEIEKGLTATQEVNVNLQVLLERAVNRQRESDVNATRAMRHLHSNLANVVYETGQLRGRLTTIANYQKQHQGSVSDVAERMREYTHMLEQAQGTIQSLQEPTLRARLSPSPTHTATTISEEDIMNSLDVRSDVTATSSITSYSTTDDEEEDHIKPLASAPPPSLPSRPPIKNNKAELYRHRIIRKRASNPEVSAFASPLVPNQKKEAWLPQQGLRLLLSDSYGF
ncbi:uncharacterized protein B0P05DRAFT_524631 [Gilbertella persicaria]|uniref:Uncharacterized protein n=1 Tax=Rhizopus stolonifer TaxID=4846 RepID=A0A367J7Y2_RHIST|nr:uncharacterized protein B0P05DRAFT_524631 [Gilbertella persicaria]KAI8095082.1 hypothetical protein B0P05DRAFT_524631 [Gilbertella persicaria]RCH86026.1 hypothetical protein CU098_007264 [Rhizopus stolonifer]